MKYSCKVIEDLLPLYHDGVCSEESKLIIKEHLDECADCRGYYDNLRESDNVEDNYFNAAEELRKASFLKNMQHKFVGKQIITGLTTALVLIAICISTVMVLRHTETIVQYQNNISVYMMNNDLVARLQGSSQSQMLVKRVENGEEDYLFFCIYRTKWDELMTDEEIFSEFVLCPEDKDVQSIDKVYYFTGADTGLESMNAEQLAGVIAESILLWSK